LTIFEVRPFRGGWRCFESEGVKPYFTGPGGRENAVDYGKGRTAHRHGEIRVLNAAGEIEEAIRFDARTQRL
jgi:hypothetical protein